MKRVLLQERIVLHQLQSLRRVTTVLRIENERAPPSVLRPETLKSSRRPIPRRPAPSRAGLGARPARARFASRSPARHRLPSGSCIATSPARRSPFARCTRG